MSSIEIDFFTLDTVIDGISDFINSCVSRSKEKGVKCQRTSTGAMIEGDKEILLEVLDELDNALLGMRGNRKVLIMLNFDDDYDSSQDRNRIGTTRPKYDLLSQKVE